MTTSRRAALVVLLGVALLVVLAPSASAHAVLRSTTPADGQTVDVAPAEVVLEFDESIGLPTGGARVFDERGERIDLGEAFASETRITVDVPDDLADGNYIVTWRAVSADGHPIKGAFVFGIGDAGSLDEGLVAQLFSGDADRGVAIAAAATRGLNYAAALYVAGLMAFLVWTLGSARVDRDRLRGLAARGAWAGIALTVVGLPLQAALETGLGFSTLTSGAALGDTLGSWFGVSVLVRLVAFAGVLVVARRPMGTPALVVGALVPLSFVLEGHTLTTEPQWLVVAADLAHVLAGAVWFGGLIAMIVALREVREADEPVEAAGLVKRFSDLATYAVITVVVAGSALSWVEVRATRALTTTSYGKVLIAKLVLAGLILLIGAYNNRRLVPDIEVAAEAGTAATAWSLLRRTIRLEVAGLVVLLLATGVLVNLQPAAEAAGITGAFSVYQPAGDGYELNLVVDPNRAGQNQVHVYVLDETGRPVTEADGIELLLSLPAQDIGPIERVPQPAGPAHWILAGNELSIAGTWEIQVRVRLGRFDEVAATIPVVVNP